MAVLMISGTLAQSLETTLRGVGVAEAQARVEAALAAQGLKVARTLNLGGQVKNFKADFPDYLLLVLEPEEGTLAAVQENFMTAIILPPTVYLHAAQPGAVTVGTFDPDLMFGMLGVKNTKSRLLGAKLKAVIYSLGLPRRVAPAMMPDPRSGMMPVLLYQVEGGSAEELTLLIESELSSNGLNVLPAVKMGNVTGIHPCKSEWAYQMFMTQPAGGFAAPCRFFVMPVQGGVLVGAIEPMLMSIMPGVAQSQPTMSMLQEARRVMSQILEAVGGRPYRPGQ
ncbi:MAG: translation initiation factor 2 [Meiothermus sp.]|uniref:translation initiation factor 2 n=1 Tax=Meiothermus sp. TaxID=1955249 RepID=UPI0025ED5F64|nr:translation initiation factor 2 [Meiothermus sp.]MCS7058091.1 translation initiation factor 2 [Meiothermus sp.]MCS7194056.1 translation initiation factor 2 [Meiothermus sp.]MCX7740427.1 translation initiation factor 2 [Meiothermus sp.]MDW8091168.1 translation initiation factor 2 [Meiothermus sp.]MDW8480454.1 translation initiation factor 2 [Meiothermus sp.]